MLVQLFWAGAAESVLGILLRLLHSLELCSLCERSYQVCFCVRIDAVDYHHINACQSAVTQIHTNATPSLFDFMTLRWHSLRPLV
jgi:hypothetical protein